MAALNAQTAVQFQQYAAQQYPNSPEQQLGLIRQLQEQHYQQYMQQLYQVQLAQQQVGRFEPLRGAILKCRAQPAASSFQKILSYCHFIQFFSRQHCRSSSRLIWQARAIWTQAALTTVSKWATLLQGVCVQVQHL